LTVLYHPAPAEAFPQTYERFQARFASHATLSLDYRLYNLKQLAYLIQDNEPAIVEAIRQDLGKAPFVAAMEDVRLRSNLTTPPVFQIMGGTSEGYHADAGHSYSSFSTRSTSR
jgi:hypothetical protein